jgi:ribosomal protein L37AE/L43A
MPDTTLPILPPFDFSCIQCKQNKFKEVGGVYICEHCGYEYLEEEMGTESTTPTRRMISSELFKDEE